MEPALDPAPIACSLDQDDMAGRQRRWHALADRAILEVARTDYGLRLHFRDEAGVKAELDALAALERACCAFADWTVVAGDKDLALDVRGTTSKSVPVVQAMFAGLRTAGAESDQ